MCHANRMILSFLAAIVAMTMLAAQAYAQDNPYRIEEGWAKLPEGRKWGATIGVDIRPRRQHLGRSRGAGGVPVTARTSRPSSSSIRRARS